MNIGTAGTWDLKWSGNVNTCRWYTTLYSKTGESSSVDDSPVCDSSQGQSMEGGRARTVVINYSSGTANFIAVYLKGIWDARLNNSSERGGGDATERGGWFKLNLYEEIKFSLGPEGFAANAHTSLGNCTRGIIEIEIDQSKSATATGTFGIIAGGTW